MQSGRAVSAGIVWPALEVAVPDLGRGLQDDVGVSEERDRRLRRCGLRRGCRCSFEMSHVQRHEHETAGDRSALARDRADRHVAVLDRRSERHSCGRERQLRLDDGETGEGSAERREDRSHDAPRAPATRAMPERRSDARSRRGGRDGDRFEQPERSRRSRGSGELMDAHPVTFTGTETPQKRSVMSMSEIAMSNRAHTDRPAGRTADALGPAALPLGRSSSG